MNEQEYIASILQATQLNDITDLSARFLNNPLVIITPALAVLSHSTSLTLDDPAWSTAMSRGYITLEFGSILSHFDSLKKKDEDYLLVDSISRYKRRFYKLVFNHNLVGFLNVSEGNSPLTDISDESYKLVCSILARETAMRIFRESISTDEDILLLLLHHDYVDRIHYLEIVQNSPFRILKQRRLFTVDLRNKLGWDALHDSFRTALQAHFPESVIVLEKGILYVVYSVPLDHADSVKLKNYSLDFLRQEKAKGGLSSSFYNLYQLQEYVRQCMFAIEHSDQKTLLCEYDRFRHLDLLYHIPRDTLFNYCDENILQMYHDDQKNHSEFTNTLYLYLKNGRSIKGTASLMHVHRNTVNYRLERIRQLYLPDLDDEEMHTTYLDSCEIIKILQLTEPAKN